MSRAVVIGSGPNGLAAAIVLARAGVEVVVREAEAELGGGMRSAELTRPGFVHDVCASVLPLGVGSPFFRQLELDVEWVHPPAPAAHPFDDGTAALLERGIEDTAEQLGTDGKAYRQLMAPLVESWPELRDAFAGPPSLTRQAPLLPKLRPLLASASALAESRFRTDRARGWFAGHAAHSMLPLERRPSAGFGIALALLGHVVGWPFARGGTGRLADALVSKLEQLGGKVEASSPVDELPYADLVLADVSPRELIRIARGQLPSRYERQLRRYRHAMGAFKLDWALSEPIPWRSEACRRAGTVHLGGSLEEIAASEWGAWSGRPSQQPFVLLSQASLFDPTRAPRGRHTAWAYCHVPNGADVDMAERMEAQVERFAPGFRDVILERHAMGPRQLESRNRNLVGGDLNGGTMDLGQLLFRPARRLIPYRTPLDGVYICSASTPPGGGVHGLCGHAAVQVALRDLS